MGQSRAAGSSPIVSSGTEYFSHSSSDFLHVQAAGTLRQEATFVCKEVLTQGQV